METASETVSKPPNFPAKFALANTDSESLDVAGMAPRSIRDRRRPSKYSDYETDFARTIRVSRLKISKITHKTANNTGKDSGNSALAENRLKCYTNAKHFIRKNLNKVGPFAAYKTCYGKGYCNNNNFATNQRTNVSKSNQKHLTKVVEFGQFSRQNRIQIIDPSLRHVDNTTAWTSDGQTDGHLNAANTATLTYCKRNHFKIGIKRNKREVFTTAVDDASFIFTVVFSTV